MLSRLRPRSAYDVIAVLALVVSMTTGVSWAADTIRSRDIVDGQVKRPDVAADAVTGQKVTDESLTSLDIDESTLAGVALADEARYGGLGRHQRVGGPCDPGSSYATCAFTSITLPRATRVLMLATVKPVPNGTGAVGQCLLATNVQDYPDTTSGFDAFISPATFVPLVTIKTLPAGSYDIAVRCRELTNDLRVFDATITALAISQQ